MFRSSFGNPKPSVVLARSCPQDTRWQHFCLATTCGAYFHLPPQDLVATLLLPLTAAKISAGGWEASSAKAGFTT